MGTYFNDICGVVCAWMTTGLLVFAYYVQVFIIVGPWYGFNSWPIAFYTVFTVLALVAHFRAQFSDPGFAPKKRPEDSIPLMEAVAMVQPHANGSSTLSEPVVAVATAAAAAATAGVGVAAAVGVGAASAAAAGGCGTHMSTGAAKTLDSSMNGSSEASSSEPVPVQYKVNECKKCKAAKPLSAHHCSTCKSCIIHLDHHCPWVNNCVGMMNQKSFLLFLLHTFVLTGFSGVTILARFFSCSRHPGFPFYGPKECVFGAGATVLSILNLVEALIFGLFTAIMMWDQLSAIFENTTYIDSLQGKKGQKRGRWESLISVFGERFSWRWFLPLAPTAQLRGEFETLCKDVLKPVHVRPAAVVMNHHDTAMMPPVSTAPSLGSQPHHHHHHHQHQHFQQ